MITTACYDLLSWCNLIIWNSSSSRTLIYRYILLTKLIIEISSSYFLKSKFTQELTIRTSSAWNINFWFWISRINIAYTDYRKLLRVFFKLLLNQWIYILIQASSRCIRWLSWNNWCRSIVLLILVTRVARKSMGYLAMLNSCILINHFYFFSQLLIMFDNLLLLVYELLIFRIIVYEIVEWLYWFLRNQ